MKIGAYQFAITNDIMHNLNAIKEAVLQASCEGIKLLVFPECALTGYPTRDIESSSQVDFNALGIAFDEIQYMANEKNRMYVLYYVLMQFDHTRLH